ncbi:MAG: NADH-quinone oxidoreductase subunit H [Candidatus Marsarchaeota archaeon]|jgi:NADH-quinone oxidoreductase subunit H|nr:NADH-quinone oxidoreductase subunit H [Candidatus Marsarchaeota archaeon]MCL5418649.1 NADH-quinone oxidoreductase subunit H [Candidatus Marsarchaeota archaeon]
MNIASPFIAAYASYFARIFGLYGQYGAAIALLLSLIVFAIALAVLIVVFAYMFGWLERKVIARAQARHGPTYLGPFGFLQNFADVIKLFSKENIVPQGADKPIFSTVLPIMFAVFVLILAFIPFTQGFVGINTTIGLLAVFVLLSFSPLLLFLAAWASGNKFSSISAQRVATVVVSYEAPMLLSIVAVVMLAGSFSLTSIVAAQHSYWFAELMPIGFVVFFIVMLAELERTPFDMTEADSELIAGWLNDYGANYYGLSLFLDYTRMFVGTLLITVLFFGGWLGLGPLPQIVALLVKVVILTFFIMFIRASLMRMKINRILRTGWLYLMPLSIINLFITFVIFIK